MTSETLNEDAPFEGRHLVPVKGPLFCEKHGCEVTFVFDYSTKTYRHQWKNGGLCSSPVEIKKKP